MWTTHTYTNTNTHTPKNAKYLCIRLPHWAIHMTCGILATASSIIPWECHAQKFPFRLPLCGFSPVHNGLRGMWRSNKNCLTDIHGSWTRMITHRIQVWYIYLQLLFVLKDFKGRLVGNYTSPLDPSWDLAIMSWFILKQDTFFWINALSLDIQGHLLRRYDWTPNNMSKTPFTSRGLDLDV